MKKVLSVLCMALLAGGMIFSSCTDKQYTITTAAEPAEGGIVTGGGVYNAQDVATLTATPNAGWEFVEWQDNSKENPRQVTVTQNETWTARFKQIPQNETKVSFNDTTWTAANAIGVDYTAYNYITFYFFKVANSDQDPYAMGFLETIPGTYDYESTEGDIMHYRDMSHIFTDVDGLLGEAGAQYWGWKSQSETFQEHITAVDLNALSISGDWSVQVGDVETYATTGSWGTLVPFTGVMSNANWVMQQPESKSTKKVKTNAIATVK